MQPNQNLYCKILISTDVSEDVLLKKVASITSGRIDQWTVITEWSEIDVVSNDDFNETKSGEVPDGFLFYPYYIDMEPGKDVFREKYISEVGSLLKGLWEQGWKAVAACDFEHELPEKGGYRAPDLNHSLKSSVIGSEEERQIPEDHSDTNIRKKDFLIPVDELLAGRLTEIAESKQTPPEALIELWLKEKILEAQA